MTTNAIIRNASVIETRAGKCSYGVACAAIGSRLDVSSNFPLRQNTVMANGAGARHYAVIHFHALIKKLQDIMAGVASCRCRDMVCRFATRHNAVMATGTLFGCATKNTVNMTCFTSNVFMLPDQRKPCGEMIKIQSKR